jgi:4-diphosphocytidyl-2-C-methyl-D-erythritol kinase
VEEASAVGPQVRVRIPSKVNLFLSVRGTRSDGYHELVTVFQTVSIYDTILARLDGNPATVHPAARRLMALAFTVDAAGPLPAEVLGAIPLGDGNLAVRAARALMDVVGVGTACPDEHLDGPVTHLHLSKCIPVAAGMAGGSADAAATLVALNDLWEADLDRDELRSVAGELGADVPFCVTGGTALATGTGTATAQVLTRGVYHWVVGISDEPLSTPEVFRAFDEVATPTVFEPDAVLQALRTGDAEALGAALHNDLEVAALHLRPRLAEGKQALLAAGALGAVVSGSGPTLVGLASSAQHAAAIARQVPDRFDRVEIAMSPAGGPEVLRG